MMMSYEDCMKAILANPEDDAPRHELAKIVRDSDPEWSEFIELDLDWSKRRREKRYQVGGNGPSHLLDRGLNRQRWTEHLDFYMGELGKHRKVVFHRGLPWKCSMNPYVFLEQGEYIVNCIAPLRGIEFFLPIPSRDEVFPSKEIAASPLLERFDEIGFCEGTLKGGEVAILASSPHLKRLMGLDFRGNEFSIGLDGYEALAANPETRKCLSVRCDGGEMTSDDVYGPIGEFYRRYDIENAQLYDMSAEGHELERKYGYIPWLHENDGGCDPADAHYFVEQRVLPRFVPGSPADAPIPYGSGIWPRRPVLPRHKAPVPGIG